MNAYVKVVEDQQTNQKRKMTKRKIVIQEPEETVDNELELLKYIATVQSNIKEDVTSDFVLCKLGDKDKEAVIELGSDAYYAKKLITVIKKKAYRYRWNQQEKNWTKEAITDQEKEKIKVFEKNTFNAYMNKLSLLAILNRNVTKNHIVNVLSKRAIEEEEEEKQEEIKGLIQSVQDKIKKAREKRAKEDENK